MKNLANCTPREFLRQTLKIKKSVEKWLELTQIMAIRDRLPEAREYESDEEARAALREQSRKNLSDALDAALEGHPDETAELLGLMCFIEPEELDNHKMADLLASAAELMECREVVDFFISLVRLVQSFGSGAATE